MSDPTDAGEDEREEWILAQLESGPQRGYQALHRGNPELKATLARLVDEGKVIRFRWHSGTGSGHGVTCYHLPGDEERARTFGHTREGGHTMPRKTMAERNGKALATQPVSAIPDTLTTNELLELVDGWVNGGIEAGAAMQLLHDRGVHREAGVTWEDFAHDRWNISRGYSYQLMDAARIVETCRSLGIPLPQNESQTRVLGPVPESDWPAVMQAAAQAGRLSAKAIKTAAATLSNGTEPPAIADDADQDPPPEVDQDGPMKSPFGGVFDGRRERRRRERAQEKEEQEQAGADQDDEPEPATEVDWLQAQRDVLTDLDKAGLHARAIRTLERNYRGGTWTTVDGERKQVEVSEIIARVLEYFGDQVVRETRDYPNVNEVVRLRVPLDHRHEHSSPPGLFIGDPPDTVFIESSFRTVREALPPFAEANKLADGAWKKLSAMQDVPLDATDAHDLAKPMDDVRDVYDDVQQRLAWLQRDEEAPPPLGACGATVEGRECRGATRDGDAWCWSHLPKDIKAARSAVRSENDSIEAELRWIDDYLANLSSSLDEHITTLSQPVKEHRHLGPGGAAHHRQDAHQEGTQQLQARARAGRGRVTPFCRVLQRMPEAGSVSTTISNTSSTLEGEGSAW